MVVFMLVYYLFAGVVANIGPDFESRRSDGRDVFGWHDPDLAGHRWYRVDGGYGGGRERADL